MSATAPITFAKTKPGTDWVDWGTNMGGYRLSAKYAAIKDGKVIAIIENTSKGGFRDPANWRACHPNNHASVITYKNTLREVKARIIEKFSS